MGPRCCPDLARSVMEAVRLAVSGSLHQSKSPAKAFVHRRAWSLATVEERMHPRDELDQSLEGTSNNCRSWQSRTSLG
jgi:hypothetical protein